MTPSAAQALLQALHRRITAGFTIPCLGVALREQSPESHLLTWERCSGGNEGARNAGGAGRWTAAEAGQARRPRGGSARADDRNLQEKRGAGAGALHNGQGLAERNGGGRGGQGGQSSRGGGARVGGGRRDSEPRGAIAHRSGALAGGVLPWEGDPFWQARGKALGRSFANKQAVDATLLGIARLEPGQAG